MLERTVVENWMLLLFDGDGRIGEWMWRRYEPQIEPLTESFVAIISKSYDSTIYSDNASCLIKVQELLYCFD